MASSRIPIGTAPGASSAFFQGADSGFASEAIDQAIVGTSL
jgi:hypothetical protein